MDKKLLSYCVYMLCLVLCCHSLGATHKESYKVYLDMYGASPQITSKLLQRYQKQLHLLKKYSLQYLRHNNNDRYYQSARDLGNQIRSRLIKQKLFSYIRFSYIVYPTKKALYITIDVVENKDAKTRLSHHAKPSGHPKDPAGLVHSWLTYQKLGWQLFFAGTITMKLMHCPVYHCMFGFDYPLLEKYKPIFDSANNHEQQLIKVIRNDVDPEKRAAAVFLMGHLRDPKKIVDIVTPAVDDASFSVRNNALRVLMTTLIKAKNVVVPLSPIIKAMNDPTAADRGKALSILLIMVKRTSRYNKKIKRRAGIILVNLLRLKQLSNHDVAYAILKKISNKQYNQWDIAAWQRWVSKSI